MKKLQQFLLNHIQSDGYGYQSMLAKEGEYEVLDRLHRENNLDLSQILYGCAVRGDIDKIEAWQPSKDEYLPDIIRGLARGQHIATIDLLYSVKEQREHLGHQIHGYAQAGVANSWELTRTNPHHFRAYVQGLAEGGHDILLDVIRNTAFYGEAVFHAACQNHKTLVDRVIDQAKTFPKRKSIIKELLNQAVRGYCQGMHYQHVSEMIHQGVDLSAVHQGLMINAMPNPLCYMGMLAIYNEENFRDFLDHSTVTLDLAGKKLPDDYLELRKEYQKFGDPELAWVDFIFNVKTNPSDFSALISLEPESNPSKYDHVPK
jgi:hypothetical protein